MKLSTAIEPSLSSQTSYWDRRARRFAGRGWGLKAVCSYGMPGFYNAYVHLIQHRALAPWLRVAPGTTVLDIGCGVGRWSHRLARAGADVIGTDIAPAMIGEAKRRTEQQNLDDRCRFRVFDAAEIEIDRRFDRIVCVTVLQHILEPERVEQAVRRMERHLAPHGRIIVLEVAPSRAEKRCNSATFFARPENEYQELFRRAGLTTLFTGGVDPLPLKTWFLPSYASLPPLVASLGLLAVTALTLPCDLVAGRWMRRASWHKVFVLARQGEP